MTLEAELEGALLAAMRGDPWGSALAERLRMVARAVLLRRGLSHARISVKNGPRGVVVEVRLPRDPRRVDRLVIEVGEAPE